LWAVYSRAPFTNFWSALMGAENWQGVLDNWEENFDNLKDLVETHDLWGVFSKTNFLQSMFAPIANPLVWVNVGIAWANGINSLRDKVETALSDLTTDTEAELISMKEAWKTQFNQMIQAAISIIVNYGAKLLSALSILITMLQNVIKPIRISILLPNFVLLAAQAMAGMQMLQDALSGGSIKGKKLKVPNIGSGAGSGQNIAFAKGGIATGSKSGYTATLHGTEAIIPLDGGAVPVQLTGGSGMTVNLTYAPMFSTVDAYELQERLTPFIERGIRDFQRGTA